RLIWTRPEPAGTMKPNRLSTAVHTRRDSPLFLMVSVQTVPTGIPCAPVRLTSALVTLRVHVPTRCGGKALACVPTLVLVPAAPRLGTGTTTATMRITAEHRSAARGEGLPMPNAPLLDRGESKPSLCLKERGARSVSHQASGRRSRGADLSR